PRSAVQCTEFHRLIEKPAEFERDRPGAEWPVSGGESTAEQLVRLRLLDGYERMTAHRRCTVLSGGQDGRIGRSHRTVMNQRGLAKIPRGKLNGDDGGGKAGNCDLLLFERRDA